MKELVDQVTHEVRGAWRYRKIALVVLWVVCLIGWAVVALVSGGVGGGVCERKDAMGAGMTLGFLFGPLGTAMTTPLCQVLPTHSSSA